LFSLINYQRLSQILKSKKDFQNKFKENKTKEILFLEIIQKPEFVEKHTKFVTQVEFSFSLYHVLQICFQFIHV